MAATVIAAPHGVATLLNAVTSASTGSTVAMPESTPLRTVSAYVAGSGVVSATIVAQGSQDAFVTSGIPLCTITLSGTATSGVASTYPIDGCVLNSPWPAMRGVISAISGAGAAVTLQTGY